jgi:hypothetical protein
MTEETRQSPDVQLQDLLQAAEAFRRVMIESGAVNHVSQTLYIEQLRALERALNPLNYRVGPPEVLTSSADAVDRAIAGIPDHLYWLMGKGRTRPREPLYGVQLIDAESGIAIVEAEAEDLAEAIKTAVERMSMFQASKGES